MKKTFFLPVMLLAGGTAFSQSTSPQLVSSAGDTFKNTSYQLDWSIGEIQTETYAENSQVLTQGFHQGTYIVTAIQQIAGLQFDISAYPNPTTDFINLKIESSNNELMNYYITDLNGRVLQNNMIVDNNQQINFSSYSSGTYIITVQQNKQFVKSFKIIKN